MSILRPLLLGLLLGSGLLSPGFAAEAPSAQAVQQSLDNLAGRNLPEAESTALQARLEQTLALLAARDDSQQQLETLKRELRDAPRLTSEAQRALNRLKATPRQPAEKRYATASLEQLEQLLAERVNQLSSRQQELTEASSLLITAQTRPERAQAEIRANQTRSLQINNQLKNSKALGKPLPAGQLDQLNAELAALDAQSALRRQELLGNSLLQDLGSARHDLLQERIRRLEQESLELQGMIGEKRRASTEQTVAELSREAHKATPDSLVAEASASNLEMSDYLLRATERLNQLTRKNLEIRQQIDSVNQASQTLEEQVRVLKGSLLLARILYQQKQALPHLTIDTGLADEIADIRLYLFELNRKRSQSSDPAAYVTDLLASQPDAQVTPALRSTLEALSNTRNNLLERMNRELNALLNEAITLQLNQQQLQDTIGSLRATLDEQMFWIPSNSPLDLDWLQQVPHLLTSQLQSMPWAATIQNLSAGLSKRPWLFIPALLVIAALWWQRERLTLRLQQLHNDLGHHKLDSQLHTPLAALLNILPALPISLLLGACGMALQLNAQEQSSALGSALLQMAQAWLVLYSLYRILAPDGLGERHFLWPRARLTHLRPQVRHLGLVVLALVAVVTIAEHHPEALAQDVLGLFIVLLCFALMAWLLGRMLLGSPVRQDTTRLRQLPGLVFIALPLGLFVAVCFGYYYTALKLTSRLIDTLYLLVLWLILEAAFERGLAVAARRLAYSRILSRRQLQPREGPEGEEAPVEEPVLNIEQVNQQSRRLLRLALLGGFIACLFWVWADLIGVFTYLDNITLYEYSSGAGAAATLLPITLLDLLTSLLIVGLTIALARNLPGLLEVLVLSRLNLAQGSAYATTTLLTYLIAGIGISTTLGTLGVSWDKLQWLVAALSVGIGFGMQAIFANFISGLILLFERPVRIGDLVTIGTVTGTVKRIRIRATHIIDSDRKEVVVPNQILLTNQLINWTLTDTITRIVLTFSVNRGADLELARQLMLQATQENIRVLREPPPSVQMTLYGSSALTYELRIYVRELGDRSLATDELNRRIDQLFQEHGINLSSVPKMDVTISHKPEPGTAQ